MLDTLSIACIRLFVVLGLASVVVTVMYAERAVGFAWPAGIFAAELVAAGAAFVLLKLRDDR
jgi:hypothetical protein